MTDPTERIEQLALECLQRRETEGDAVVERVCSEHPDLADDIRSILQRLERTGLLEEPGVPGPARVGDFQLERCLGSGGMGIVHLARQDSLGRRVALKRMRPGFHRDPKSRERFRREIAAISKLDHPGICTVYEAGEVDDTPYLAMRYVEGESLAAVLERRGSASSTSRAALDDVALIEKVARALHVAHEAGVVHRDVKPGNIMIDRDGEPVVMDFGLAREEESGASRLTRSGETLGTPAYMAPEQISGTAAADRRTDVYALGVTLYECLTGRTPFDALSRENLYRQILSEPPPDPRTSNRHVGSELRAVLDKCLEKDPRRRFATALELADELGRILRHEPTRTRAPGLVLRTVRWCQRNRTATIVLGVVSVALMTSLWFLYQKSIIENRLRALALMDAANDVRAENPRLAAKLGREALRLHDDPRIIARLNEILFDLRDVKVLHESDQRLEWVLKSPDGEHLLITSVTTFPVLYRTDGTYVGQLPVQSVGQRPASVAFSTDGKEVAVGDVEGRISVFDVAEPSKPKATAVATGSAPDGWEGSLSFSADDQRILFSNSAGAALWHRSTGEMIAFPRTVNHTVWSAAFVEDRIVASGRMWTADGRHLLAELAGDDEDHESSVRLLQVSAGGDRFLTASSDRVRLWRTDGTPVKTIRRETSENALGSVISTEFSPAGDRLLVTFADGPVWLLDAADGRMLHGLQTGETVTGRFSPNGRSIVLADWHGKIRVCDRMGSELLALRGHGHGITWLEFLDAERILSTSWDGSAWIWRLGPVEGVRMLWSNHFPDVALVRDKLVVSDGRGKVVLLDETGSPLRSIVLPTGTQMLDPAPDGRSVLIWSPGGPLHLWDTTAEDPPRVFYPAIEDLWQARLRPDGKFECTGSDMRVTLWDPENGSEEPLGRDTLYSVVCGSPDGALTVAGRFDGGVELFSVDWQLLDDIPAILARSAAFSPDGRQVLLGCSDGRTWLWDLEHRTKRTTRGSHHSFIPTVAWSRDGTRFATGGSDSEVRVWDPSTMEQLFQLQGMGRSSMWGLVFLRPDLLVTSSLDGTVRWWWLDPDQLLELVDDLRIEELTEEERGRFPHLLGK